MVAYTFGPQPAVDIATARLVAEEGLSGQLYASEADAQAQTSPLTVTVAGSVPVTSIAVSAFGQLPEFVVDDLYQVWWRGGDVIVHLMSFDGLLDLVAASEAATAASAADAGATSAEVETLRQWIDLGITRRNHAPDPRATDAARWAKQGGGGTVQEQMITGATDGPVLPDGTKVTTYARYTVDAVSAGNVMLGTANFLVPLTLAGKSIAIAIYVRSSTAVPSISVRKDAYLATVAAGSAQAVLSSSLAANSWERRSGVITNNADFDEVRVAAQFPAGSQSVAQIIDVTCALFDIGATTVQAHFDGDSPSTNFVGNSWSGTPNDSTSEQVDLSTLVRTVNGKSGPDVVLDLGSGGGTTDHNALSNLTVGDPHTQYLNVARGDQRYYSRAQVDAIAAAAATQTSSADRTRSNHTGTQAISTIVGLQDALDSSSGVAGPDIPRLVIVSTGNEPRPDDAVVVQWYDGRDPSTPQPVNMGSNDIRILGAFASSADLTAPSVPTGLSTSAITASSLTLSWTASTDNVGVTGYEVRRDGSVSLGVATGTSRNITGLTQNTTYSFDVRARDAAGNWSGWSTATPATTSASSDTTAPTVPTGLASSNVTGSSFTITWGAGTDNVGVTGYDVRLNAGTPETIAADPRSKTWSGLAASTLYTAEVRSRDAAGNVSAYVSLQVTTSTAAETYSVYGAPAPTGTWAWAADGTPYIVISRGFLCSAAGARVVGGRAWIPAAASGSLPTEVTFTLHGPEADIDTAAVQTKVVATGGATAGSWVEALFDTPQAITIGQNWIIGVRFTGTGDAGKYSYAPDARPNNDEVISNGPLAEELAWAPFSDGTLSAAYEIGTGGATLPNSGVEAHGVDILVDLGG